MMKGLKLILSFILIFSLNVIVSHAHEIDTDRLIGDIKAEDWEIRISAYKDSNGLIDDKLTNSLIDILENRYLNWKYRIRIIQLLGESKKEAAFKFLNKIIEDPFLNHDCPAIKWNTVTALRYFPDNPKTVDILLDLARFEDNPVIREAIVLTLGKIKNPKAIPFLINAFKDKSFAIRFGVINSISEIGDINSVSFLKDFLSYEDDPYIRDAIIKALEKLTKS